jgi:hypothetical protein
MDRSEVTFSELPLLFLMILLNSLKEGNHLFLGLVDGRDDFS